MRFLFFILLNLVTTSLWATTTVSVHASVVSHTTQIDIYFSEAAPYSFFTLENPARVVIDIPKGQLEKKIKYQNIRYGYQKKKLRIVIDLKDNAILKNHFFKKNHLMIDITSPRMPANTLQVTSHPEARAVVIVIDPGHGGVDAGAIGFMHVKEKNVVLALSTQLVNMLNEKPGFHASLTRHTDRYLSLWQRLKYARKRKADLFISIHADSYFNKSAQGASVFALSRRGATSLAARWLAVRENHSELGNVNLENKSYLLRSVLIDLAQTATVADSLRAGNHILRTLGHITPLHYHRVEQADFMVLKSPDIPSLLIETGFLSNDQEAKALSTVYYQRRLAQAILQGIEAYVWQYPPYGTVFATEN